MSGTTIYPGANTTAQWFADNYPGVIMSVTDILVLHTTEGGGWPAYDGGALAPTMTIMVDTANRRLLVRQHFPLDMSARALKHPSGTPATNTAGAIQIELIGTCDPSQRGRMFYWPEAPTWVLDELAKVIATLHKIRGIPLKAWGEWKAYPASSGNTSARMSWTEWSRFSGVCGHQHVPGNDHGDPGNINITYLMTKATELAQGDDMSAADVSAINAHFDSKIDDIAALAADKVWAYLIGSAWNGQKVPAAGMLSSAQRYAIEGGWPGVRPDGNGNAGSPSFAAQLAALADGAATVDEVKAVVSGIAPSSVTRADLDALNAKLDALAAAVAKLGSTQ